MDLELTDDQRLLVDTFAAFFAKESSVADVRAADGTGGHDAALWSRFWRLGGPLLSVAEEAGGGGGTLLDAALVGFEAGRRLAPIAYAASAVAARFLADASGEPWDALPVGETPLAWGLVAAGSLTIGAGRLSGRIGWIRNGASARWLVADTGAEVALVDLDGGGVERRLLPNLGCFPLAEIRLDGVVATGAWPLPDERRGAAVVDARVLNAAELVGAGRQAIALARGHVLERRQFERPLATFQSIQHRLADRHTALDAAELLVLRAASSTGAGDDGRYSSAVALLRAGEAAELAAKEALQFFGGYGFTLEYDVHLYLRFAKALAVLARDPALIDDALPARLRGR